MRKGSLYRIYPGQDQKQVLEQHFGGVRFLIINFFMLDLYYIASVDAVILKIRTR